MKIPTLYNSLQELYLDTAIYGKIVSSRARNKEELKGVLFEEFKLSHPLPTLELKRYELSDMVSDDFAIGDEELELQENEGLIDLTQDGVTLEIPESLEEVPNDVKVLYNYENRVTDELREKYLQFGIEEYTGDYSVFGTIKKNEASILTDEEIEELETGNFHNQGGNESYEEEELDDDYTYEEDEDEENEEEFDYEYEDEEDEEELDYEYDDEEDYEYDEDEENDDEEDYEYGEDEEDDDEEDYEYDEDEEDHIRESAVDEQLTPEAEEFDSNAEQIDNKATEKHEYYDTGEKESVDNLDTDDCFVEETFSERASPPEKMEVKEEESSIDDVPRDLRQFLRKYPRCDIKFALKYFSKKEIDKAILIGKIVRRGNKLHI